MTSLPKGVYRQRKTLASGEEATYYRWRSTGERIKGEPGTEEFENDLARIKAAPPKVEAGTWNALVLDYKISPDYRKDLKPSTQKYYDRQLERAQALGPAPVPEIKRREILGIRDALAMVNGSQAANQFVMVMSVLMDFAVEREYRESNPLAKLKRIKGGTYETWNDAQIRYALTKFEEHYRRAALLALYTGQREGDCCAMKWSQYDGTAIEVAAQQKTLTYVWIPVHRTLRAELDRWRGEIEGDAKDRTILVNSLGRAWPTHSFAAMLSRVIGRHPPLSGLVFHGLRKAAAARLAEAGCSTHEIAAITGHQSLAMVELYTKKADRKRRAISAMAKLELVPDS
jgi:integrase